MLFIVLLGVNNQLRSNFFVNNSLLMLNWQLCVKRPNFWLNFVTRTLSSFVVLRSAKISAVWSLNVLRMARSRLSSTRFRFRGIFRSSFAQIQQLVFSFFTQQALFIAISSKIRFDVPVSFRSYFFFYENNCRSENVLVYSLSASETVCAKLTDFGSARNAKGHIDENGRVVMGNADRARSLNNGTPIYMAPQLFQKTARPSEASDTYSLGVLFYEIGKFKCVC